MTYRYPVSMQLRAALSLVIYCALFSGVVSYWMKGGPQETRGRVIFGVATVLLAGLLLLLLQRQVRLAVGIQTTEFGLTTKLLGWEKASIAWLEVDEVRPVGVLGGFQVRSNAAAKVIDVEHAVQRSSELRKEIAVRTGK